MNKRILSLRILSLLLAAMMLFTMTPIRAKAVQTKTAVPVEWAESKACYRALVVTLIWRAMGFPETTLTTSPFPDVPTGCWYTTPVLWAVEAGITDGMDDGTFGTIGVCNRVQAITFLWRAFGCPEPNSMDCPFTDVDVNDWYGKAVLWALENGITTGMTETSFGTSDVCTRKHIVKFIERAFGQP